MPSVTNWNHSNPRLNSFQSLGLTATERREAVAGFFAAAPVISDMGRAVADFVDWQIRSGRIGEDGGGSPWWRAVNGSLVLDLIDATAALSRPDPSATVAPTEAPVEASDAHTSRRAGDGDEGPGSADAPAATGAEASGPAAKWVEWARCDPADRARVQALLWEAHQASLHAALARAEPLLADEPPDERWFALTAVAMVEHAAATGQATDTDLLDRMTRRHYPDHYPATPADRAELGAAVAAHTGADHDVGR